MGEITHLRQETCEENEGGEAGWLLQTAAVQATPSSPPAAAVVVDAAGAASEAAAAAAAAEEEGLASVHFPHGPSPPPPASTRETKRFSISGHVDELCQGHNSFSSTSLQLE